MSTSALYAGVLGWPVEHSLSPRLHNYWLKHLGLEGEYKAFSVAPADLDKTLKELKTKGFRGVNLTVPHKEAALSRVDYIDATAKRIGAVNTVIVKDDGFLEGRNTDAYGFSQNLIAGGYHNNKLAALILGAGGAARAVIVALQDMGVRDIRIMNRTFEKAEKLAHEFSNMEQSHFLKPGESVNGAIRAIHRVTAFAWGDDNALKECGLLVNATILGMERQPPLTMSLEALPKDAVVTDLVYAPLETALLKSARARGHKTIDGLGMLLHQARPAFKAFFGVDPDVTLALRAYVLEGR